MDREIKFRAWDTVNKVWIEDDDFYVHSLTGQIHWADNPSGNYANLFPFENDVILMQYTGLKDKNGKDIYEGDIVNIHQTVNGQKLFVVKNCLSRLDIRYAHDDRKYEYDQYELLDYKVDKDEKEIEVIGNIYENH